MENTNGSLLNESCIVISANDTIISVHDCEEKHNGGTHKKPADKHGPHIILVEFSEVRQKCHQGGNECAQRANKQDVLQSIPFISVIDLPVEVGCE